MNDVDRIADALFDRFRRTMATALLQPVEVGVYPGVDLAVTSNEATLSKWIDVYEGLLLERGYDPQTVKNRRSNLKHIRLMWGASPLRDIKPRHISSALQAFLPDRSSMARRIFDELRDMYREAVANDWCESNPVLNTRRPPNKVKRKRLSLDVWDSMCEVALVHRQPWVLFMLLLALVTGQRRADLAKMRVGDVCDTHLHIEQQKKAGKAYGARVALPLALTLDVIGLTLGDVIDLCQHYCKPGPTLVRRNERKRIEMSSLSNRFNEIIRTVMGNTAYADREWPSLHEIRSLSERLYRAQGIQTQHLLGHKHQDMTDKYNDDRGLTAAEWKHLAI